MGRIQHEKTDQGKDCSQKSKNVDMLLLGDVVEVAFRKGDHTFCKLGLSEELYMQCDF